MCIRDGKLNYFTPTEFDDDISSMKGTGLLLAI